MPTVADLINQSRQELLDLTTKNRLLSIPKKSSSARLIHAIDEKAEHVFRMLVDDKKAFGFIPGRASTGKVESEEEEEHAINLPPPDVDEDSDGGPAKRHVDTKIQTALTPEGLQRRLLDLHDEGRTMMEEQGVNILFFAIGQLKWTESGDSETARYAPLILVPVELVRRSASDRFQMRCLEQKVQENLSLAAKLKNDFALEMPKFEVEDAAGLAVYFESVRSLVRNVGGWEVMTDEMTLGFFSFAKFLMYRDLDPANWPEGKKIDEHPMMRSLMSDGFVRGDPPFGEDAHIDELIPASRLDHVKDADGSQTLVIEHVRRGHDLVVQGPPGTGKSQTITNIIATAVLDGKKVLFVAEKMAALEVVHRRLTALGLGEVCLELHSNKTNKRSVLAEIGRTWKLNRPVAGTRTAIVEKLESLRLRLSSHATSLNSTLPVCGLSPFRILGELALLRERGVRPFEFRFPSPESWNPSRVAEMEHALADAVERLEVIGIPSTHPWRGVALEIFLRLDEDPLRQKLLRSKVASERWIKASADLADYLRCEPAGDARELERQRLTAEQVAKAPPLDRQAICNGIWNAGLRDLKDLLATGRSFAAARAVAGGQVVPAAWDQDFTKLRADLAAHGDSLFRIFNGDYRKAIRDLKSVMSAPLVKPHIDRLKFVDTLIEGQKALKELKERAASGRAAFGEVWRGEETNWDEAQAVFQWVEAHSAAGLSAPFRELFSRLTDLAKAARIVEEVAKAESDLNGSTAEVAVFIKLDSKVAFGSQNLGSIKVADWLARCELWLSAIPQLPDWVNYFARTRSLRAMELGSLVDSLESGALAPAELVDAFSWTYYGQLLRHAVSIHPELGSFDGILHERSVQDFREVDRERLQYAKYATLLAHYDRMPSEGEGVGPTGILSAEIERKRGHKPIRQLLKQAGDVVQAIKPVFMMSPLSVAQFLEPGSLKFDLLVIDEASQVEPVDALGSIARADQLVVVGDSRQLPPTKFFSRMTGDGAADDDGSSSGAAAAKDLESVLGLCKARGLPEKMLRWHYRSRHHTLIAVSNHEFYEDGLFIVPSPLPATGLYGLRFHHVPNGIFDSGKTAVNKVEAEVVARAVIAHAKSFPTQSLGVAAFSIKQRQAIQDELELLRRQHPETESFFAAHPHEPFFVKNLENVQGDERDVIFISVGYGKDATGFLTMGFGPLSRDGGERRLNVLISRAKMRCEVFSSIKADEIDLNRAKGRGVASFKSFLRFAETGKIGHARTTDRGEDSVFEEAVRMALEKQGLAVDSQVGEAGFFIDLAIRDESRDNRYVLAIECDGAAYHSSKSSRDRDRLRQAVLEDHGWHIHRIWSTDWFQRPERELRRVMESLERARQAIDLAIVERKAAEAEAPVRREDSSEPETGSSVPYSLARIVAPLGVELLSLSVGQIAQHVRFVVETEAPIHFDEIVVRIRSAWGLERAGARIQEAVQKALRLALHDARFAMEGEFVVDRSRPAIVRNRSGVDIPASLRRPERISGLEIRSAVLAVVEEHLGASQEEIPGTVGRMLGSKAVSAQLREMVEEATQQLVLSGQITLANGFLRRARSAIEDTT